MVLLVDAACGGNVETAAEFVKILQATGLLVDPYSDAWITAHPEFSSSDCEKGGQPMGVGQEAAHHLLVVFVPERNQALKDRLVEAFPALAKQFAKGVHHPDFLFLNQVDLRILSVGLGRKCRLFVTDSETGARVDVADYLANGAIDESQNPLLKKFLALDHLGIFRHLVGLLDAYGMGHFYGPPKLVIQARKGLKKFFPVCDPATLNTHDF